EGMWITLALGPPAIRKNSSYITCGVTPPPRIKRVPTPSRTGKGTGNVPGSRRALTLRLSMDRVPRDLEAGGCPTVGVKNSKPEGFYRRGHASGSVPAGGC